MLCVACSYAAPLLPEAAKQYLILTPQPAIHIQPQLIQPISHLSRLQAPNHVLLYYPSTPLAPFQLNDRRIEFTNLKQSEELVPDNNPWDNFLMQIQGFFQQFNPDNSTNVINQQIGSRVGDLSSKFMIPMMPADAEQLPAMAGETPASTVRLDKRFYIISGQPQFYGNFDALKNPLNPIFSLQSLQPIKARSSSTIDAIPPQIVEHQVQPQLVPIQAFSPIEPLPLQLKATPEVYGELLGGQQQGRELLDDEEEKKEDSKQGRSQSDMPAAENALAEEEMKAPEMLKDAEMLKAAEMMNDGKYACLKD